MHEVMDNLSAAFAHALACEKLSEKSVLLPIREKAASVASYYESSISKRRHYCPLYLLSGRLLLTGDRLRAGGKRGAELITLLKASFPDEGLSKLAKSLPKRFAVWNWLLCAVIEKWQRGSYRNKAGTLALIELRIRRNLWKKFRMPEDEKVGLMMNAPAKWSD